MLAFVRLFALAPYLSAVLVDCWALSLRWYGQLQDEYDSTAVSCARPYVHACLSQASAPAGYGVYLYLNPKP